MRILHVQEADPPSSPDLGHRPASEPAAPAAQDNERVETLEKMTASIFEKLNAITERITALEKAPVTPAAPPVAETPKPMTVPVSLDADAIKKGLMTKMWTYLNDKAV